MTHVSRKRQKSEDVERDSEAESPKKKKLRDKSSERTEAHGEARATLEASATQPTYTAKLFQLELMSEACWLSALEKFHDAYVQCEEEEAKEGGKAAYDIVLEYCRIANEGFAEILQHIHVRHKRAELSLCFQVLCDILQRIASKTELSTYLSVAERVARVALTRHVQAVWYLMTNERGKSKSYQIKVAVRFLSACVSLNDELAKFTWERMGGFGDRVFQALLHRTDLADAEDVRMCAVQLLLSFLLSENSEFVNNVLCHIATFTNIFARLRSDKFATLVLVLSTLIERVLRNERVQPNVRKRFFTVGKPPRTDQIASLADWRGPQRSEFWNLNDRRKALLDAATDNEVLVETDERIQIVHDLVQTLLTELNAETVASNSANKLTEAKQPVTTELSLEAIAANLIDNEKKRRRFVQHVNDFVQTGAFRKQKHATSFCKQVPRLFETGLVFRCNQLCTVLATQTDCDVHSCVTQAIKQHVTAKNANWVTALLSRSVSQRNSLLSLIRLLIRVRRESAADVVSDRRDGAMYLCAYGASLSELDCALYDLLCDILSEHRVRETLRPYLWGSAAVDHFRVERDRANAALTAPRSASLASLLLTIDAARMLRTCVHFPTQLQLTNAQQVIVSDLYDPRFLLTVFADLLHDTAYSALTDFVERHCLSLAIAALSSHDQQMRQLGSLILARYCEVSKRRDTPPTKSAETNSKRVPDRVGRDVALMSWREELRLLLDLLRCAMAGNASQSDSDKADWQVARLPCVLSSFFVRTVELIVNDPQNELYRLLYDRVLDERNGASWRRLLSDSNPSLFVSTFLTECVVGIPSEIGSHAKAARAWALQLLVTGLLETCDYQVLFNHAAERHNQLLSVLLATLSSSVVDERVRSLSADALLRVIHTCPESEHCVMRSVLFNLLCTLTESTAPRLREHLTRLLVGLLAVSPSAAASTASFSDEVSRIVLEVQQIA